MGDPFSRRHTTLSRLRHQLKKKRESLADQFDFKMFIIFHFKHQKKPCAVFEIAEVVPVMTNNYEESILKGVKEDAYSLESSKELLEKDVVQLHAPRWQSMRKDVIGCTTEMDFFLWPRNDIDRIECLLFSRWKGDENAAFKPLKADFEFLHDDYEKQLLRLLARRDKNGLIINNSAQSMFFFIDRQQLEENINYISSRGICMELSRSRRLSEIPMQISPSGIYLDLSQTPKNKPIVFKLSSVCLYLPQDRLTYWAPGTCDEIIEPYLQR